MKMCIVLVYILEDFTFDNKIRSLAVRLASGLEKKEDFGPLNKRWNLLENGVYSEPFDPLKKIEFAVLGKDGFSSLILVVKPQKLQIGSFLSLKRQTHTWLWKFSAVHYKGKSALLYVTR